MGTLPVIKFGGTLPAGHVICRRLGDGCIEEYPGLPLSAAQMESVKVARAKKQARVAIAKYKRSGLKSKKIEKRIRQYHAALRDVEAANQKR